MPLPHVVALGGGHGLYASLRALRPVTETLTAIVTVADDGGSSGRLREELGVVPPGDLRMALSALCEDTEWGTTWRDVLQTRFSVRRVSSMATRLATSSSPRCGSTPATSWAVSTGWRGCCARRVGCCPSLTSRWRFSAVVDGPDGPRTVRGQVAVAKAQGRIVSLALEPADAARSARDARCHRVGGCRGAWPRQLVHVGAHALPRAGGPQGARHGVAPGPSSRSTSPTRTSRRAECTASTRSRRCVRSRRTSCLPLCSPTSTRRRMAPRRRGGRRGDRRYCVAPLRAAGKRRSSRSRAAQRGVRIVPSRWWRLSGANASR